VPAISWIVLPVSGAPFTKTRPSSYSTSSTADSSMCAPTRRAFALMRWMLLCTATVPTAALRLPYEP
jgi:hypothetical protein